MKVSTVIAGAFALALSTASAPWSAGANPIDVSYTVSGSAGHWTYDFSVTNNLSTPFVTYLFGANFASDDVTAAPTGWKDFANGGVLPFVTPGLLHAYENVWVVSTPYLSSIQPGQTLSGFEAVDTSATKLISLDWFAFDIALTDGFVDPTIDYTGTGCSMSCGHPTYNPGFQGVAVASVAKTPLPAALPLFATGVGALGLFGRRRKTKTAA
ncbi:MAG TPA: VPLPA-CTERM sorting domain-containing protein [Candidatus Cybelea sp.]|nr:VPLPA-CTERM sorting domain-containing protein [Candidatus Cybelea sp.]